MPAPIFTNIHRKNELTNNRQQLLADGFSFYAVAEISTTAVISKIPKLVKDLSEAERAVTKELEEQGNARGSQELTIGDMGF